MTQSDVSAHGFLLAVRFGGGRLRSLATGLRPKMLGHDFVRKEVQTRLDLLSAPAKFCLTDELRSGCGAWGSRSASLGQGTTTAFLGSTKYLMDLRAELLTAERFPKDRLAP